MAKKENNELEKRNQAFLIYQDENGILGLMCDSRVKMYGSMWSR